jgi:hypothetical protein
MARLPEEVRIACHVKLREWARTGAGGATKLHAWAKANVDTLLGHVPSLATCKRWARNLDTSVPLLEAVKDLPRDQSIRKGKRAPINATMKAIIVRKARDKGRPDCKRRAYGLSREAHGGRGVSLSSVTRILTSAGLQFKRKRKTITLKPHHIQFRLRWAQKWAKKPAEFWQNVLFSDEKIFRVLDKEHAQNGGLWLSVEDDKEQLDYVYDRHSTKVSVWAGFSYLGKVKLIILLRR